MLKLRSGWLPRFFLFQGTEKTSSKPAITAQDILLGRLDGQQLSDADLDQWTDKMASSLIKAYRARQSAQRHAGPEQGQNFQVT